MGLGSLGALLAVLLYLLGVCCSQQAPNYTFLHNATSAPKVSYYDYIVVGGGTAGCPLAATLSEKYNVLLIERGGSPYGNPNVSDLALFGAALADTSPESASQPFTSEDGVFLARARVLGGGSAINAGFYSRASVDYVNSVGWDHKLVNDSYKWVEKYVAFEPSVVEWQAGVRDGLLEVGVIPDNGFTYDHIPGTKTGGSIFDQTGYRHTAADLLQYANSKRLTVLLRATVDKILFSTKRNSKPAASGVVFTDASGVEHGAYLNKGLKNEIIVSAGALGSPQLLMLSGVGPAAHLKSHDIPVVLNHPTVGQGMADNPMNPIYTPSPIDVETSLVQVAGIDRNGTYILAMSGFNIYNVSLPLDTFGPQPTTGFRGGLIVEKVANPLSTGYLELRNRNPNDNPSVTFNYFKDPADLKTCVQGVRLISSVIESEAFSRFTYPNVSVEQLMNLTLSSSTLNLRPRHENASTSPEQYCIDAVTTIYHYHGGCQVGNVVDRNYKVLGVDALRVVDGSTFTVSPGTNPQATVMMLGRYVGVNILNGRLR